MSRFVRVIWNLVVVAGALSPVALQAESRPEFTPEQLDFFEKKVRPVLATNCFTCHSASTNSRGGLRVDDRNGLLTGGGRGAAVVPGDVAASLLLQAVKHEGGAPKMPPSGKLSDAEIQDLETWVASGAAWPSVELPAELGENAEYYADLKQTHWAWQPLKVVEAPVVDEEVWSGSEVDRFVRAKLTQRELQPVGLAEKVDLIRRVTFDLTGLPPTPEEIDAFLADESEAAYELLVDRLLESPAYGERWGRHWLDVARYGESTGSARNLPYPHAWRYRDYVIDSFNADKPYDQFLREQIAGDLLPATSPGQKVEQLVATGFLALGVKDVNQRFRVRFVMDNVDEQIDTVTRSVLALTVSCARCHDHKFDPVPAEDYYALAGIFTSTDNCSGLRNKMGGGGLDYYDSSLLLSIGVEAAPPADLEEKLQAARVAVEQARAEFQRLRDSPEGAEKNERGQVKRQAARQRLNQKQAELVALNDPANLGPVAFGARDAKTVGDTPLRIRGEAELHGPVVPRGFLSVIDVPGVPAINPRQSGRLELAEWLASPNNPLTSRVIVNRVWKHLYGEGLVTTVDNFGITGASPSHPELLDFLAAEFVNDGWSIKRLVRRLVLTRSYRLGSASTPEHLARDPANRLLWRHSPRRLTAEEIRDATLVSSGAIDRSRPVKSLSKELKVIELRNNGPEARTLAEEALTSRNRSVYLPMLRTLVPTSLDVFDFAEQGMVTGRRDTTTVAPQALYLLNDPFVREQSERLARRLLSEEDVQDVDRVREAYRIVLGRQPTTAETWRALGFISEVNSVVEDLIASSAEEVSPRTVTLADVGETAFSDDDTGAAVDTETEVSAIRKPQPSTDPASPNQQAVDVAANPDDPVPGVEEVASEVGLPRDSRTSAWAAFCQALLGSAEFRYLK